VKEEKSSNINKLSKFLILFNWVFSISIIFLSKESIPMRFNSKGLGINYNQKAILIFIPILSTGLFFFFRLLKKFMNSSLDLPEITNLKGNEKIQTFKLKINHFFDWVNLIQLSLVLFSLTFWFLKTKGF